MMADVPEGWSTEPPDTTLPKIIKNESGGRNLPPQANYDYPRSHASGIVQYQPKTWQEVTKEFGVGQQYSEAYQAPTDVQKYIAYRTDQKYGPNSSYTWAASAPPGGYPQPHKPAGMEIPTGWGHAKPKAAELPPGWGTSPGLHDRPPVQGEPWRVSKKNEGQVVHGKRDIYDTPPGPEQPAGKPAEGLDVERKAWEMMRNDPMSFFKKLGSAVLEEGKGIVEPLGVVGDVAQGKAKIEDPETQKRAVAAGTLIGGAMETPAARIKSPAIKPEGEMPIPGANHPAIREAGVEGKPGFITGGGDFVNRGEAAPIAEAAGQKLPGTGDSLHSEDLKPGTSAAVVPADMGPKAVSAASTPLSEIVTHNLKTFEEENAKTPQFKEGLRAATNTIKTFTAPETIKDPLTGAKTGERAAAIVRKNVGRETQIAFQARAAMDKFSQFTNGLNLDEQLSLIKWMQSSATGKPFSIAGHPDAAAFASVFKDWMDTYKKKLQALPQTEQMEFRENYVPQMWKNPDQAKSFLFGPGRTGRVGFTKQHVFDDYEEGIRAGMAPVSTNPMEIFARYVENASTFVASKEMLNDAKDEGLIIQQPQGTAPPEGYVSINDRAPPGAALYAPQGFAEVYNNYRSQLPQGFKGDAIRAAQFAANKTTAVRLAFSLFHPVLSTKVAWASGLADAITKAARGDILGAGVQLVKTPAKPFTSYFAARKVWRTYLDGEFGDPRMKQIVQGLVDANFDFLREGKLADEYRTSRLGGFIKSLERGRLKLEMRDALADIKNRPLLGSAKAVYDTAMRSLQTTMEPTFQYYVPWLKTQAAVDAAKTVLDAKPDITPEEFVAECRKISDNIDARFGELNRNNIFWSQTQKAIAQASAISYSYVYGIAKNALGAGFDLAKLPYRAVQKARGKSAEDIWTDRLSFAIALPVIAITTNAIYQYLKTGNAPNTISMEKPQTGGTNEGQPERAVIPGHENSYLNFFNSPGRDLFNKLNPLWQTAIDLGMNQDYRDKQIVDPQDPVVKRIMDGAKYAAEEMGTPISFEGASQKKAGSNISGPETALGIRSAGMKDTNPGAFKQMMNYKDSEAAIDSQIAKINDKMVQAGRPRLHFNHFQKQKLIEAKMQGKDPLASYDKMYGGTQ